MDENKTLWTETAAMPARSPLRDNVSADVCIVGAGLAGLSCAYTLTRAGKTVVVLEGGTIACGATHATTAHLASAIDNRLFEIERLHGSEGLRIAAQSHAAAIDFIEAIVHRESIDCDFSRVDGYLFLGPGDSEELLDRELEAAHHALLPGVEKLPNAPIESFHTGPCLRFPNQGQFHPLKYLLGLIQAIEQGGGRIFTHSHVANISGGAPVVVSGVGFSVTADAVIVATNIPINDRLVVHTKQAPYMTYAIGARVPRGSITKALYWDTQDPYHYVRLQSLDASEDTDILIVGGEDHKTGQVADTCERFMRLETWARECYPMMTEVVLSWSGQVMETIDGLAFIGRNPLDKDNVYIVTGDSGQGMTHGTIAGMMLVDLVEGRAHPWAELYSPSRKTLRAAGRYTKEAGNMAAQYAEWLTGGDGSIDDLPLDFGTVVRRGLTKVAVYRDSTGELHECSAVCPHLGCIVHWNPAERTWDCPCHGSRFDKLGGVISGPANRDLTPVKTPVTH